MVPTIGAMARVDIPSADSNATTTLLSSRDSRIGSSPSTSSTRSHGPMWRAARADQRTTCGYGVPMGLWTRIREWLTPTRAPEHVARVRYLELTEPLPRIDPGGSTGGYAFAWPLVPEPRLGERVVIPGGDGRRATGVVIGFGRDGYTGPLESVLGRLSAAQAERVHGAQEAFFSATRRAVGLSSDGRRKIRDGWPEVPPVKGDAKPAQADTYARTWWRIYHLAEQCGRAEDEVKLYKAAAHRWFAIRDRQ